MIRNMMALVHFYGTEQIENIQLPKIYSDDMKAREFMAEFRPAYFKLRNNIPGRIIQLTKCSMDNGIRQEK